MDLVPRYQESQDNDLAALVKNQLMLGPEKRSKREQERQKKGMPSLNPEFKSEAYDSEDDYEEGGAEGTENEYAGFRLRRDEEYETNQEWKR